MLVAPSFSAGSYRPVFVVVYFEGGKPLLRNPGAPGKIADAPFCHKRPGGTTFGLCLVAPRGRPPVLHLLLHWSGPGRSGR